MIKYKLKNISLYEMRDFISNQRVLLDDEDFENQLPPYSESVVQRILNEEINPHMPTEDVENQIGYVFIYYFRNRRCELQFDIPDTWEQWATTFVDMHQSMMYETQFIGQLRDRDMVENVIRNKLQNYKNEEIIGEFRIRRNYVMDYEYHL